MRPATFETFALAQVAASPLVARTAALRDVGDTRHPYCVAVQWAAGGEHRWQVMAESATGDNYATPERPVEGDPAPIVGLPELTGPIGDRDAEQLLAHILTTAGSRELVAVSCWSERDPDGTAGPYGLTIRCHSGATIYVRAVRVPARRGSAAAA